MAINALTAASILRYIAIKQVIRNAKADGTGKLKRALLGLTESGLRNKRVLISNDQYDENPCTCFWALINRPKTANDIILQEAKGVLMAHFGGSVAGAMGTSVSSAYEAYGTIGDAAKAGSMASGGLAGEINDRWSAAYKAGVWSSAKGTAQEFSIGLDYYLIGGVAAFVEDTPRVTKVAMRVWPAKRDLISFMGHAEREGRNTTGSIAYTRSIANQAYYTLGADSKLEKVDAFDV